MLMYVLKMHNQGCTIATIARNTNNTWQKTQRWIAKATSIKKWIEQEYADAPPCFGSNKEWSSFTRDLSWAFYPKKMG